MCKIGPQLAFSKSKTKITLYSSLSNQNIKMQLTIKCKHGINKLGSWIDKSTRFA